MASCLPAEMGHHEYRQLITFVRATPSDSNSWKQQPATLTPSFISGAEAKSFYEELCADNGLGKKKRPYPVADDTESSQRLCDSQQQQKYVKRSHLQKNYGSDDGISAKCNETSGQSRFNQKLEKTNTSASGSTPRTVSERFGSSQHTMVLHQSHRVSDHRQSELLRLAQNGDNEGVKVLLQKGVDVDGVDHFGWTAAMSAAFEGHVDVVETLVKANADLTVSSSKGYTALSLAQKKHHSNVVQFIESFHREGFMASRSNNNEKDVISFYCDVCKSEFSESDKDAHKRSTVHIFNMGQKPKDDSFLIPPSNVGFRLMMKTGWDGSRGLGPCGEGQRFPVKTLLKQDRKGLGNTVKDKAKVTHFKAHDKSAISQVQNETNKRVVNVRTLSRRAQRAKERKERQWEIHMRHELN